MPPQDQTPPNPSEGNKPPQKPSIDPASVLLPKKETPGQGPDSAQRINAGALLEQEERAGEAGLPKPAAAPAPQPAPAAAPKTDDEIVRPIETYKGDIERLVQDKNVSVVSIAAAEAQRRGQNPQTELAAREPVAWANLAKRAAMILAACVLVVAAGGILYYFFLPHTVPLQTNGPQNPLLAVDGSTAVVETPGESRDAFMADLNTARQNISLALGLVEQLVPEAASTTLSGTVNVPLDAQTFLTTIAPDIPQSLVRNIEPTFLLGAHVYMGNDAFLILKVDDYETAYSGMLAWEPTLAQDLSPLFSYTPTQHIPEEDVATITPPTTFLQTNFVDDIVDNHDARVLENSTGDIYLLWTFLDKNTLVIATDSATLQEIISRLTQAPVSGLPAQ